MSASIVHQDGLFTCSRCRRTWNRACYFTLNLRPSTFCCSVPLTEIDLHHLRIVRACLYLHQERILSPLAVGMNDSDCREKRRQRRWSCMPVKYAINPPVTRISLPSAMAVMYSTICLFPHGTSFDTPWAAIPLSHTLPVFARHQGIKRGLSRRHYVAMFP